ncbi:site-specific integrase [Nguyenibacter vanlangensis]|uniref:Site-specific integrase n=1 Tax=Nguyenibacter vanlangensis TaxID=1216886 RepID=A0ABZ3D3W5_9PROT
MRGRQPKTNWTNLELGKSIKDIRAKVSGTKKRVRKCLGGALYLQVGANSVSWEHRYGVRWHGLGSYPEIGLKEAREMVLAARRQLREGKDPIEERRAARRAAQIERDTTFRIVAGQYIEAKKAGWKNARHTAQWPATLEKYVHPIMGDKPVNAITTDHVRQVLDPIWHEKTATASNVRNRIEIVLDYAKSLHMREGENPARWKGHLQNVYPAPGAIRKVSHHAAIPWADLPLVMSKLAESDGMAALALRFLVLTALRSSEVRGAKWGEIDLDKKTWTIPAERMKGRKNQGQEHCAPLSDAAIEILTKVALLGNKPDRLVFPSRSTGRALTDVALSQALGTAGAGAYTVHGMRSTFSDWAEEKTSYPSELRKIALAHVNKDKVDSAYARSLLVERRRPLMQDWADYATGPVAAVKPRARRVKRVPAREGRG